MPHSIAAKIIFILRPFGSSLVITEQIRPALVFSIFIRSRPSFPLQSGDKWTKTSWTSKSSSFPFRLVTVRLHVSIFNFALFYLIESCWVYLSLHRQPIFTFSLHLLSNCRSSNFSTTILQAYAWYSAIPILQRTEDPWYLNLQKVLHAIELVSLLYDHVRCNVSIVKHGRNPVL